MLDLGGQRQPCGASAPFVQIGEAPVDDHHVGQRMGGLDDELHDAAVREGGHGQLQQTDCIPAVGHRCNDLDRARSSFPRLLATRHVRLLGTDHPLVDRAAQLDPPRLRRTALR